MSEGCDRAAKLCLIHSGAGESEKCAIHGCDRFAHICVEHKAEQVRKAAEYVQKAFTGYTDAVHVVMTPFHGAALLRHLHDLKKESASTNDHKTVDEIIERVKAGINIYLKKR